MRDQFVADVNDFGKYGLLRWLCGVTGDEHGYGPKLKLGVAWYYLTGEVEQGGGNTGYLDEPRQSEYYSCDPVLWHTMKGLVAGDRRLVSEVEGAGILPSEDRYHREVCEFAGTPNTRPAEHNTRYMVAQDWLANAVDSVRGSDVVFLDPDQKIAPDGESRIGANGPMFAHMVEIRSFWRERHNIVIYHQTGGEAPLDRVRGTASELQCALGEKPITLHFRPAGWTLVFFVIPQPWWRTFLAGRIKRMLAGPWGEHFKQI